MARGPRRPRVPKTRGFGVAKAPPRRASVRSLAGSTIGTQTAYGPQGLSGGRGIQYRNGQPVGAPRVFAKGVKGLAPGYSLQYDAQGRASFVKAPAQEASAAPAPAPAPAAAEAPAAPAPPAAPDWRNDPTYTRSVADLMRRNQEARAGIEQEGQYDQQDYDRMAAQMKRALVEDLEGADYGANQQGLLYSGTLGKRRGLLERDSSERQADARTAFDRRVAARKAALEQMGTLIADPNSPSGFVGTGDAGSDLADLVDAAIGRRILANDDIPAPVAEEAPEAAPPSEGAAAPKRLRSYVKNGWFYREASDGSGRMLRIRPASGKK